MIRFLSVGVGVVGCWGGGEQGRLSHKSNKASLRMRMQSFECPWERADGKKLFGPGQWKKIHQRLLRTRNVPRF